MRIGGMQKLTLLDYPGNVACLIFTQGCNFRCPFCHNKDLLGAENKNVISEEEVFSYLEKRKGVLDGVVISGGEPLLQEDIEKFMTSIKSMGYKIKLDTNGSNPSKLKKLIDKGLVDYIAMDVKNEFKSYDETSGVNKIDIENIKESVDLIKSSNISYEFRTTIVKQLHNFEKIKKICNYLGPKARYYIQNYRDCETVLVSGLEGFSNEELEDLQKKLNVEYPNVKVRGL